MINKEVRNIECNSIFGRVIDIINNDFELNRRLK
jgi:hypothetical protein